MNIELINDLKLEIDEAFPGSHLQTLLQLCLHEIKLLERQKAETEALNAALTLKLKELRK